MELSLTEETGVLAVQAYTKGKLVINQRVHDRSLILSPRRVVSDWRPQSFEDLLESDFAALLELSPEIVILGTGARQRFPSPQLYHRLIEHRIGLEAMATAPACRTYNILVSEGRRVVAALMMIR